jgi:phage terminase Nu1 subunit (DNA packaging protein)
LPNASSGGAARIKVSSKYIVNNAEDEPGKDESQEVEDLRKRIEAQQAEITRLKNQQRELS